MERNVVHGHGRFKTFWRRRRNDCAHAERGFSRVLYFRLPFAATSGRRIFGFKIESAILRENLQLRQLPQQAPHDVGVDQFVLGRVHRPLRPALLDGRVA